MNNEINNIDDLFDDSIDSSLRQLGFVFPSSSADFNQIEENLKNDKFSKPASLQDPYSFLGKRRFNSGSKKLANPNDYSVQLAQAARDGSEISDEIKTKMAEDKLKSKKGKDL